ncbi:MAG: serine/threonine protein kinase [Candidatus Eremiobacteraeota bacterium]|nr:serine/threonine protein kinase [Candidatus Eremiobacteraeota bacterium]
MILPAATMVGGRYQVVRLLAEGGMSYVYEVSDSRLPGRWALKQMKEPADGEAVAQFTREADILATLEHPNLPRVSDHFVEGDCRYLVMQLVEGKELEAGLDEGQAIEVGLVLCDALEYLHSHGLVYRDLKPGNVMRDGRGHLWLVDFGIARFHKLGQSRDTVVMGTPGYAAPEQYGQAQTDARADLYALGVLLHHLVSGYDPALSPFRLPALEGAPRLAGVVRKATQLEPEKRYQSAAELRTALKVPEQETFTYPGADRSEADYAWAGALTSLGAALSWAWLGVSPTIPLVATLFLPFWLRALYRDRQLSHRCSDTRIKVTPGGVCFEQQGQRDECNWKAVQSLRFVTDPQLGCRKAVVSWDQGEFEFFTETPTEFFGLLDLAGLEGHARLCERIVEMAGLRGGQGWDEFVR